MYECDMTDASRSKGWISPKLALVFAADGSAKVVDGVIMYVNGAPIPATVVRNNANRAIVKWSVKGVRADNGTSFARFNYRASVTKKTGQIELTAIPSNFDTGLRSGGKCRKRSR